MVGVVATTAFEGIADVEPRRVNSPKCHKQTWVLNPGELPAAIDDPGGYRLRSGLVVYQN